MIRALAQNIMNFSVGDFLLKISLMLAPVALTAQKNSLYFVLTRKEDKIHDYY